MPCFDEMHVQIQMGKHLHISFRTDYAQNDSCFLYSFNIKIVSTREHHTSQADRNHISNNEYSANGEAVGYMYFIVSWLQTPSLMSMLPLLSLQEHGQCPPCPRALNPLCSHSSGSTGQDQVHLLRAKGCYK